MAKDLMGLLSGTSLLTSGFNFDDQHIAGRIHLVIEFGLNIDKMMPSPQ